MKEKLEHIEELIQLADDLAIHSEDQIDREIHQSTLDVATASWFMYASGNWE